MRQGRGGERGRLWRWRFRRSDGGELGLTAPCLLKAGEWQRLPSSGCLAAGDGDGLFARRLGVTKRGRGLPGLGAGPGGGRLARRGGRGGVLAAGGARRRRRRRAG